MSQYLSNITQSARTLVGGLRLTLKYLFQAVRSRKPVGVSEASYFEIDTGIMTLQYPHESLPVPETGRYRLHNEIDDCIVCDKCAKICPVDCIEIEPIKDAETFGTTSDGTPKRIHAARFDIDMGKCCFCGLCTTVCPTECLTMTKVYDFSEFDVKDHKYSFSEMSLTEIALKRQQQEEIEAKKIVEKAQLSEAKPPVAESGTGEAKSAAKPVFRPKVVVKPSAPAPAEPKQEDTPKPKPVFRPKPIVKKKDPDNGSES